MKIIIIGPAHPLRGGIATFNERLAQQFQAEGHQVKLYTFSLQYPNFLFPGKTQFSPDPAPDDLDITININSVNPFNWLKVGRQIKKEQPDLVICRYWLPFMGPCLGTILRVVRGYKKTKVIALADNIIPHEKRPGDKLFTQYFVGACDHFVVMSRAVAEDLKQFTTKKSASYTPHPIYDNYGELVSKAESTQTLNLAQDCNYVLFFGFIRQYKGLDLLLLAMADERIKSRNIKALVAGEYYDDKAKYEAIIQENDLAEDVIIKDDFIPTEEVKHYFGAADLVVQPYKSATQSGISQMAYHFEKPMVVTNVGGLPEIVAHGKSGYVTEVNAKAIADAIVEFYDQEKAADFIEHLKEEKKRFGWDIMTKVFIDASKS